MHDHQAIRTMYCNATSESRKHPCAMHGGGQLVGLAAGGAVADRHKLHAVLAAQATCTRLADALDRGGPALVKLRIAITTFAEPNHGLSD
jgi:hypothetical protein